MEVNGPVVRALRIKDGWTIAGLAMQAELTPSHLSNIEADRRGASPATVKRLAEHLGVPMSVLLHKSDQGAAA